MWVLTVKFTVSGRIVGSSLFTYSKFTVSARLSRGRPEVRGSRPYCLTYSKFTVGTRLGGLVPELSSNKLILLRGV